MNRRWRDGLEELIWRLHASGAPVSEISEKTHCDGSFVRAVITGVWAADGNRQVMRDAV